MPDQHTTRRNLVKGAAWVAPAIVVAAPAPAMAISGKCVPPDLSWSKWTTTSTQAAPFPGTCGGPQPELTGRWWVWCDGGTSVDYVFTRRVCFPVKAGQRYTFSFSTQANAGVGTTRSPSTLAMSIGPDLVWFGYTQSSANPGGTVSHGLTLGFAVQNWTVTYTAPAAATTLCMTLTWTAFKRGSGTLPSTDDIGISAPTAACA